MRSIIALLLTTAALFASAGTLPAAPAPFSRQVDGWDLTTTTREGTQRTIVFRYAKHFVPSFRRTDYGYRVILVWPYKSDNGMPKVQERQAMDRLEDQLTPHVEDMSVLALVSTGENWREWVFYTRSDDVFIERLNRALGPSPRYPIEIHTAPDGQWETYERFLKGLRS